MIRVNTFFNKFIRRAALAGVLALATSALVAQAQVLSSPKNISNNAGSSGLPRIAVDSRGNINVVWVDDTPGNSDIFFSRSADGGATFSTPKNLSNSPDQSYFPVIALDSSGNINVVWHDVVVLLGNVEIFFFFSRSTDGGATFSTPKNLFNNVLFQAGKQIAVDSSGNINLVWQGFAFGSSASSDIFFSRSTDGGTTFSTPKNLSNNTGFCGSCSDVPQISVDRGGNINVVWPSVGINGSNVGIFFSRSSDGGANFSTPKKISNSTNVQVSSTQIAVDLSGNIKVIWEEDSGNFDIFFTRSTDGGTTFSTPKNLSNKTGFSFNAEIAVDTTGNINVVWEDTTLGLADVFFSRSSDGGGTFSAPRNLTNNNTGALLRPQIAVDPSGNINVVWEGTALGQYDIFLSRSTDGGATFSPPKNLSNNSGWSLVPQIALDSLGNINVVWEDNTPGQYDIFVGTVAGGPLKPTGLNAVVGEGSVYLRWDPSPVPVNGYNILVDRIVDNTSISLGTVNPTGQLIPDTSAMVSSFANGDMVQNGQLYKFSVTAVANSTQSLPSDIVFAVPTGFSSFQLPPPPDHPILFLHGISSDASTWNKTIHYLSRSVGWSRNGGNLFYRQGDNPLTDQPQRDPSFQANAYFYTVNFSDNFANSGGIARQGDEVGGLLRFLRTANNRGPFSVVGHSMGGLAARSYIERNPLEAKSQIFRLITYGTPHRGLDLNFLTAAEIGNPEAFLCALPLFRFLCPSFPSILSSVGAADMDATCGGSPSRFLQDLNSMQLPSEIKYTALRGHTHTGLQFRLGLGDRLGDCLQSADGIVHSDSFVSIESANLKGLTPSHVAVITTDRLHFEQTEDFPTILCVLDVSCAFFQVMSPIDIEVTAPNGQVMTRNFSAIPGASYMNIEDQPGHEAATLIIPFPVGGQYVVKAIPKPGAPATDTFTITLTQNGVTTTIADHMRIQDIPPSGFHPHVNSRPVANAGPDQVVECSSHTGTPVILNGSASIDSDGDPLTYRWTDENGNAVGTTTVVNNAQVPLGMHSFTLTVTDPSGFSSNAIAHVTVRDTTTPSLSSLLLSPNVLWPPNHKLVPITATIQVSDTCDPNPTVGLFSITSNEPDSGLGDIQGATFGTDDRSFLLRAERSGSGTGRVYTVTFRATDHSGNSTMTSAQVRVPHDQGNH